MPITSPTGAARSLPVPHDVATGYGYVCLGYGCGLSWRTEIKAEWFSGQTRWMLVLGGRWGRGTKRCDCGMGIFQVGKYAIFEIFERREINGGLATGNDARMQNYSGRWECESEAERNARAEREAVES